MILHTTAQLERSSREERRVVCCFPTTRHLESQLKKTGLFFAGESLTTFLISGSAHFHFLSVKNFVGPQQQPIIRLAIGTRIRPGLILVIPL